jgi:hypothetical protein
MPEILDFKPFLPSDDYAVSKAFYEHLGAIGLASKSESSMLPRARDRASALVGR